MVSICSVTVGCETQLCVNMPGCTYWAASCTVTLVQPCSLATLTFLLLCSVTTLTFVLSSIMIATPSLVLQAVTGCRTPTTRMYSLCTPLSWPASSSTPEEVLLPKFLGLRTPLVLNLSLKICSLRYVCVYNYILVCNVIITRRLVSLAVHNISTFISKIKWIPLLTTDVISFYCYRSRQPNLQLHVMSRLKSFMFAKTLNWNRETKQIPDFLIPRKSLKMLKKHKLRRSTCINPRR